MSIPIQVKKLHSLTGHTDCVYTIVPSGEPSLFFSGSGDGRVVLWDLKNSSEGEQVAQLPNSVYAICSLPGSDVLAVGHNYDGLHLIDWRSRKEIASRQMTTAAIFDIVPNGVHLIVAAGDGIVTVVDPLNLTAIKKLQYSSRSARTLAVNPVTNELAVGYSDNCIRIFDLGTYTLKKEWEAHVSSVFTLRFTPDGSTLLSGSRDARLKAWSTGTGYALEEEIVAHLFAINDIEFSPDGKHFVTCSMDKSIKVWETSGRRLIKVIDKARHAGHGTSVNKLYWSSFNSQLISAGDDRMISVWALIF
jgi:WD40 repeat protein